MGWEEHFKGLRDSIETLEAKARQLVELKKSEEKRAKNIIRQFGPRIKKVCKEFARKTKADLELRCPPPEGGEYNPTLLPIGGIYYLEGWYFWILWPTIRTNDSYNSISVIIIRAGISITGATRNERHNKIITFESFTENELASTLAEYFRKLFP